MRKYLILDGLFEGSRMFTGATSAVYLLSKGLPLNDLAQLKMLQALISFLLEFPTGVLADLIGRRRSLLISLFFGLTAYMLYRYGQTFLVFAAAEVSLSVCLCCWSGAYEAYSIKHSSIEANPSKINRFFHLNSSINSACIVLSGWMGARFALMRSHLPFEISSISFIALAIWIFVAFPKDILPKEGFGPESKRGRPFSDFLWNLKSGAKALVQRPDLLKYALVFAWIQFLIQPLIYYWQPFFQQTLGFQKAFGLGEVFVSFQLAILGGGLVAARFSNKAFTKSLGFQAALWAGYGLSLISMSSFDSFPSQLILFCAAEAFFTISLSGMKAEIGVRSPSRDRAAIFSGVSLFARMGALSALAILGFLPKGIPELTVLKYAYLGSGLFGILLGSGLLLASFNAIHKGVESVPSTA